MLDTTPLNRKCLPNSIQSNISLCPDHDCPSSHGVCRAAAGIDALHPQPHVERSLVPDQSGSGGNGDEYTNVVSTCQGVADATGYFSHLHIVIFQGRARQGDLSVLCARGVKIGVRGNELIGPFVCTYIRISTYVRAYSLCNNAKEIGFSTICNISYCGVPLFPHFTK